MTRRGLMAICLAFTLQAHAVYLNPEGRGQALIYPYYSVQSVSGSSMNTYLSIANDGGTHKAVRVRIREGRNGRAVASFNLFLPSGYTWTGALVPTAEGARLVTTQGACTDPAFTNLELAAAAYSGASSDGLGDDPDRLREGYVEVIAMAALYSFGIFQCADLASGRTFDGAITPDDGISGTATVINVANGMEFSTPAAALAGLASRHLFRVASDPYPDFDATEVDPVAGFMYAGSLYKATTGSGLAAVEAVLTKQTIYNDIVLDPPTASETDWVFTFPTRRFHANETAGEGFPTAFVPGTRDVEAGIVALSRQVSPVAVILNGCNTTCLPGEHSADLRLPWAATVWSFRTGSTASAAKAVSDVLGARNGWRVTLPTSAPNGSVQVVFGHPGLRVPMMHVTATRTAILDGSTETRSFRSIGLPVVGFMARTLHNGFLSCAGALCQGNYGAVFAHRSRAIVTTDP